MICKRQTKNIFEEMLKYQEKGFLKNPQKITQTITDETNLREDNQMVKNKGLGIQLSKIWLTSNTKFGAYPK